MVQAWDCGARYLNAQLSGENSWRWVGSQEGGQEVLRWVVAEAVGSAERGVDTGDEEGLPSTEEAAEIQTREGNGSAPSGVCPGPGAPQGLG